MIKVGAAEMTQSDADLHDTVVDIFPPARAPAPIVFASPHSGRHYPEQFLRQSALAPVALRSSEDAYVDRLFADAPDLGATLIAARFPRAFVDVNREPWELDPAMFDGALPPWTNASTPRVAAGLGVVPRVVAEGAAIYTRPLPAAEANRRVETYHQPYHRALEQTLLALRHNHGTAVLIDCHSMPSQAANMPANTAVDIVLGDRFGASCAPELADKAEAVLRALGLSVARNTPYAGGYCTGRYGRPAAGLHALQIEINRALYLDEKTVEPNPQFDALQAAMRQFTGELIAFARNTITG